MSAQVRVLDDFRLRVTEAMTCQFCRTDHKLWPVVAGLLPQLRAQPDRMRLVLVKVLRAFEPQVAAEDTLRFATLRLALLLLYCTSLAIPMPAPGVRADIGADVQQAVAR